MQASGTDTNSAGDTLGTLRENSLKAAGYGYLVGDAALFASGMMAGRYKEASSGLIWWTGGIACAKYGNPDAEKKLELLSGRLGSYLRAQHVAIPASPDTAQLLKEGGLVDKAEAFLYKYPSQVLNATYAIGGVQLMRSGFQHRKGWDAASGALVTAGAVAGLLVKEKAPDPSQPPEGIVGKAAEWLQEKPLRIPAGFYLANNGTLLMGALSERKQNPAQKSYLFKFLTAAAYLFGNVMLGVSSKEQNGQAASDAALEKLGMAAARVLAAQAPEVRAHLLEHIAGFLAAQPETGHTAAEISAMLHEKLAQVGQSRSGGWQGRVQQPVVVMQNDL